MSLNRDQINSIAHLARLSLTEAEIPVYQDSLSKIVDLVVVNADEDCTVFTK